MFYKRAFISFVFMLFLSVNLFAQQADTLSYMGEDVIIVASKITGVRGDITMSHDMIDNSLLERENSTPALDVIESSVPSFNVTKKGAVGYGIASGSAGDIRIRGIGSSPNTNVLVLIDGRPEFMGMMGHPLPDVYLSNHIEKIEVIKGPASTLYGSNAMGGVVNIITRKRKTQGFSTSLKAKYGSFNTGEYSLSNEGRINNTFYNVIVTSTKTDGEREWSAYKNNSVSMKLSQQLSKNYEISFSGNHTKFNIYDPGIITSPVENHWYNVERNWFNLSLDNNSTKWTGSLKVYANTGYHSIYDGWRSNDITSGILFYEHLKLNNSVVTFGFDYKRFGGKGKNIDKNIDYGEHFITEYAPYLNIQYFTNEWVFNAGYRLEKNSVFGYENAPKFAVMRDIGEGTVKFNISKGYRSPTIRELYLFPAPTPDLKPEKIWSREISFKYPVLNRLNLETSVFHLSGSNFIKMSGAWPNFELSNSGTFKSYGLEFTVRGYGISGFDFNFAYAWLKTEDQNTGYNPEHKLNIFVLKNFGKFETSTSLQKVWNYYASGFKKNRLPDYLYMKINAAYMLYENLSVHLTINNVLNTPYQIMQGYPMPGRQFYLGLGKNFGRR